MNQILNKEALKAYTDIAIENGLDSDWVVKTLIQGISKQIKAIVDEEYDKVNDNDG